MRRRGGENARSVNGKQGGQISNKFFNILLPIIVYGMAVGMIVGVVVWGYGWVADFLADIMRTVYAGCFANPVYIPLLFLGLILCGVAVYFIQKYAKETEGSGVPRTEGVMRGVLHFRWIRTIFATILSSFISFIAGLSLGYEGPSIQIGGAIGQGVNSASRPLVKRDGAWERYNIIGGASAGFATAFHAPLAGIMFALEEGVRRFSPMILLPVVSSVFAASVISRLLTSAIGAAPLLFDIGELVTLPIADYGYLLILGVATGLFAALFSLFVQKLQSKLRSMKKNKYAQLYRLIAIFVLTGIVGLFLTDALGGGAILIAKIADMDFSWQVLLLLLVVKLLLTVFSVGSGATGGIFIPMLALGALTGGLFGKAFIAMGMATTYYNTIVIISMAAFMGAVLRSPLTAMVLIVETTGFLTNFLTTGIAIMLAYFIVELFGVQPLYEAQLGILEREQCGDRKKEFFALKIAVEAGSFADGKTVRDILWPANCTVLRMARTDDEGHTRVRGDRDGERHMRAGDTFTLQTFTYDIDAVKRELDMLIKNPDNIGDEYGVKRKRFTLRRKSKADMPDENGETPQH